MRVRRDVLGLVAYGLLFLVAPACLAAVVALWPHQRPVQPLRPPVRPQPRLYGGGWL